MQEEVTHGISYCILGKLFNLFSSPTVHRMEFDHSRQLKYKTY